MKKLVFFSFRNFERDGGGSIRMYGILNALAEKGENIAFISNAQDYSKFHPAIKHQYLNIDFKYKAIFQALLAIVPTWMVFIVFKRPLTKIIKKINDYNTPDYQYVFFEYLDNSIGYLLKKSKRIRSYINDIHGISTIEFDYQRKNSNTFIQNLYYALKFNIADKLDKKVFENADGLIYSSNAMKAFFETKYNLEGVTAYFIPYLLLDQSVEQKVNYTLKNELSSNYRIQENEFIIFFAGGFKPTSGVDDLVEVFSEIRKKYNHLRLMIIGNGPIKPKVDLLIDKLNLRESTILIESVPYDNLITYQSLANLIVCPDRHNTFSDLVVHLKYLDSLLSGKLVLNGAFKSVKEINPNDSLSLTFTPSDKKDLYDKIELSIKSYSRLNEKYKNTRTFTQHNLTYSSYIDDFLNAKNKII